MRLPHSDDVAIHSVLVSQVRGMVRLKVVTLQRFWAFTRYTNAYASKRVLKHLKICYLTTYLLCNMFLVICQNL